MKYNPVAYQTACVHPSRAPNWYLAGSNVIPSEKSNCPKSVFLASFHFLLGNSMKYTHVAYQTAYLHPSSAANR